MKSTSTITALIWLLTLGALAGMSQVLTTTFQLTGSGLIGTPATATTSFQGQTFTSAAIKITAIGDTATVASYGSCYYTPSDSATISIGGVGSFQLKSTGVTNCVTVDPVKGVIGDIVYFVTVPSTMSLSYSSPSPVATALTSTTAWNLLGSFGPFQAIINLSPFQVLTNSGTLQFTSQGSNGTFQAALTGGSPTPALSRADVFSHIAANGGWNTLITLVNTSSAPAPVTVSVHNDDGSAMTLPLTTTLQGVSQTTTASSVNGTINPNATLLISMGGQAGTTVVGWADVLSSGSLGGYAIFRQTPNSGSPSEVTVPLQSQFPTTATLSYDNTAGFVMGVALANLSALSANVTATIWDDSGNQLGVQMLTIAGNGHSAFVLPSLLSLTAGRRGIVKFQASGGIAGIGLRFSPFGTFTSVPTM